MTDLPDLTARLRLDTSELDKAVGRAAGVGSAIGSAVGNVAGGALNSALGAVTSFTTGSVDAFAALEDATAAAGVLFGTQAGVITAAAEDAANRVGLSSQQYIDAAGTIGTFGKAAGLQGAPLTDFTTKLADLSGDLASFKGTSTEQAVEAVGAALRGESEPIRAYGVLLDEATIKAEALSMGLVKSERDTTKVTSARAALAAAQQRVNKLNDDEKATSVDRASAAAAVGRAQATLAEATKGTVPELTKQQKLLATQSAIMKQTTDATGDFARTSDSTANTQKRLAAESANAQAELGARLAPALTAVRVALLGVVTGLSGMFDWISSNLGVIVPLAAFIAIATVALNAHAIVVGIVAAATRVWTAVQAAFNLVMNANPISLVIIAIAALVAAIVIAYQRSATFRAIVDAAMAGVRAAFERAMNAAKAVVASVMAFINGDVSGKLATVRAVVVAVLGFIVGYYRFVFGAIRAVVSAVLGFITGVVRTQLNAARNIISGVLDVIVGIFTGDFGRARDGAVKALGGLLSFVGALPGKLLGALGSLGGLLVNAGAQLMQGLADGIMGRARAVLDSVRNIAQQIKDFFPGSPVKRGPLTSWNGGAAGSRLGGMLADGLDASTGAIRAAANRAAGAASIAADSAAASLTMPTIGGGTTQLLELSPASLAALTRALPDVLVQVLLDSEPIAAVVNTKLGSEADSISRVGG